RLRHVALQPAVHPRRLRQLEHRAAAARRPRIDHGSRRMNATTILPTVQASAARGGAKQAARAGGADAFQGVLDAQSEQLRSTATPSAAPRQQEQRPADATEQNVSAHGPAAIEETTDGHARRTARHEPRSTDADADAQQTAPAFPTDPQPPAPA